VVTIGTLVSDNSGRGISRVSATYTIDGTSWQRGDLQFVRHQADGDLYALEVVVPQQLLASAAAFVEIVDNRGNVSVDPAKGTLGAQKRVYLPSVSQTLGPDLVGSFSLVPDKRVFAAGEPVQVVITITNQGSQPAAASWADLFINPSAPPSAANTTWNMVCALTPCLGLTWQVPPLAPGQSVTLSSAPGSYSAPYSAWPGWFASGTTDLYLYVDSWNPADPNGAVVEISEYNNRAELHGLTVAGSNPALFSVKQATAIPRRP
jgi:hypothetical protein